MATRIVMEALSPTMEEGRLVAWKKQEGDPVAVGDVIAEVETDKAVMELVARAGGVLLRQLVPAGAPGPGAAPGGGVGGGGESGDGGGAGGKASTVSSQQSTAKQSTVNSQQSTGTAPRATTPAPAATVTSPAPPPSALPPDRLTARIKASPLARKIAAERGVDLTVVTGSGPEGRVVRRDLEEGGRADGRSGGSRLPRSPLPPFRPSALHRRSPHPGPEDDRQAPGPVHRADPDVLPHQRGGHGAGGGGALGAQRRGGGPGQGVVQRHRPQGGGHVAPAAPRVQRLVAGRPRAHLERGPPRRGGRDRGRAHHPPAPGA